MEWTSDWIRVWFFPRTNIPSSITSGAPNITEFGIPRANFEMVALNETANCTIDQRFAHHQVIFDTTLCGAWAGEPSKLSPETPQTYSHIP